MASFRGPSSNSDPRFAAIENELVSVRTQVISLSNGLASENITSDYRVRLTILENEYEVLRNQVRDQHREGSAASENFTNAITTLTQRCNELNSALNALVAQREQDEAARLLPVEIVEKIRSRRFADAETLLLRMADNDKIFIIVHDVYENSEASIDIILDCVKALTKIYISFYFLKALRHEMHANGHRNVFKMIALAKLIESEVMLQRNCSAVVKDEAQIVFNETVNDIKAATTESLKEAIYSRTYQTNVQVENLLNAIAVFRTDVSDEVMQRIASESYPAGEAVKIANDIFKTRLNHQKVSGLVALFRKLQDANDLNNKAVLSIAGYLKQLLKASDLSAEKISNVNEVIQSLPTCARNLFFEPYVCLWNRGKSEYLFPSTFRKREYLFVETNRRYVASSNNGERPFQIGDWYVKQIGDHFHFESKFFTNEYLYAANFEYNGDNRWVFTWTLGGTIGDQSAWSIELDGDYCRLRNKQFNEFLYASNEKYDDWASYIFTAKEDCYHGKAFQWQIRT